MKSLSSIPSLVKGQMRIWLSWAGGGERRRLGVFDNFGPCNRAGLLSEGMDCRPRLKGPPTSNRLSTYRS